MRHAKQSPHGYWQAFSPSQEKVNLHYEKATCMYRNVPHVQYQLQSVFLKRPTRSLQRFYRQKCPPELNGATLAILSMYWPVFVKPGLKVNVNDRKPPNDFDGTIPWRLNKPSKCLWRVTVGRNRPNFIAAGLSASEKSRAFSRPLIELLYSCLFMLMLALTALRQVKGVLPAAHSPAGSKS